MVCCCIASQISVVCEYPTSKIPDVLFRKLCVLSFFNQPGSTIESPTSRQPAFFSNEPRNAYNSDGHPAFVRQDCYRVAETEPDVDTGRTYSKQVCVFRKRWI